MNVTAFILRASFVESQQSMTEMMADWLPIVGWVILCVTIPVAWGIAINMAFDAYSARRGSGRDTAPPDYQI